jgi:small subunit ribosomal protein S14
MNLTQNINIFNKFIVKAGTTSNLFGLQQVRNKWADWRMIKDQKKRMCIKEKGIDRLRVNTLRKNDVLPAELREIADKEIAALPRDSSIVRIKYRCAFTSRPRGVYMKYRLSRIVWRSLADYNKLSGVQRAMW